MHNRGISNHEVSLPQHLWMLRKILTVDLSIVNTSSQQSDAEQRVEHLLCYIVATCYPKILRRLTNQLSQSYSLSLLSLWESTIYFWKPKDCHTPTSTELASDCHLAHFIISLTLPIHKYPNIVAQANSVVKGKDTHLYTKTPLNLPGCCLEVLWIIQSTSLFHRQTT